MLRQAQHNMATKRQITAIHTMIQRLNISNDDYKNNLRAYGVEHSNDPKFTNEMASDFINKLSSSRLNKFNQSEASRFASPRFDEPNRVGAGQPGPHSDGTGLTQPVPSAPNNERDKSAPNNERDKYESKYKGSGTRGLNLHITPMRAERISILEELLNWNTKRTQGFIFKQTGYQKSVEMLTSQEGGKVIVGMTRIFSNGNKDIYIKLNNLSNRELKKIINPPKAEKCTYKP
jgi:hypothetical protein